MVSGSSVPRISVVELCCGWTLPQCLVLSLLVYILLALRYINSSKYIIDGKYERVCTRYLGWKECKKYYKLITWDIL